MKVRRKVCGVIASVLFVLSGGCVPDSGYVAVEYAPPGYAYYPHAYYQGHIAYYVDGRWYAHRDGSWVYYRREPPELYRYRIHAPPAYPRAHYEDQTRVEHHHGHDHGHGRWRAPPARRSAPPAERVR